MHPTTETLPASWRRTAIWWVLGLLSCVAIGLLGALLPAQARLLGLFGACEGLLVGAALAELVSRLRMVRPRLLVLTSFLFGLAAFAVTTHLLWRSFSNDLLKAYPPPPTNLLRLQLQVKDPSATGTESAQELDRGIAEMLAAHDTELSVRRSFPGYLVFRVAKMVSAQDVEAISAQVIAQRQASEWAKWLGELTAAGIAAGVVAHRSTRRNDRQ